MMGSPDLDTAILEMTHSKELFQKNHEERMQEIFITKEDFDRKLAEIDAETKASISKLMEELDDI